MIMDAIMNHVVSGSEMKTTNIMNDVKIYV